MSLNPNINLNFCQGAAHGAGATPPATPRSLSGRPSLEATSSAGAAPMHMSGPRLKMALPTRGTGATAGPQAPASPLREDAEEGLDACASGADHANPLEASASPLTALVHLLPLC